MLWKRWRDAEGGFWEKEGRLREGEGGEDIGAKHWGNLHGMETERLRNGMLHVCAISKLVSTRQVE